MPSHKVFPHAQGTPALRAGGPVAGLARAGRDPQELARASGPSAQAIRTGTADADRREGRRQAPAMGPVLDVSRAGFYAWRERFPVRPPHSGPWCPWPESNQHSLRNSILSRARLPIPPQGPGHATEEVPCGRSKRYSGTGPPVNRSPRPRRPGGDAAAPFARRPMGLKVRLLFLSPEAGRPAGAAARSRRGR